MPCIADGVYGEPASAPRSRRRRHAVGVRFTGLWLEAPEIVLEERVEARTGDASDADARIVRLQRRIDAASVRWHRLRADGPFEELVAEARALIERS